MNVKNKCYQQPAGNVIEVDVKPSTETLKTFEEMN